MASRSLLTSTLLCIAIFVNSRTFASDVLDLTDANFDGEVSSRELMLIEFFAPWVWDWHLVLDSSWWYGWCAQSATFFSGAQFQSGEVMRTVVACRCGHCKRLAPEYETAATKLKKNDPPVTLAKVDCTAETAICSRFGVQGYPTLKIFRHGEFSAEYDGPREADGIVKYMRGQAGASSKEINSLIEYDKFVDSEETAIIGLFSADSKLRDSFLKVADTERDRFRFAHSSNPDVLDLHEAKDDIVAVRAAHLNNKFESNVIKYDGSFDTEQIKKFLNNELQGLAGHRRADNLHEFTFRPMIVAYYNIDWLRDPKGTGYWRNRVLKVASEFERKIRFAISSERDFTQEIDEFGIDKDKVLPGKVIVAGHGANGEKYPMNEVFSVAALNNFAEALLSNSLEPFLKSEPIPDSQDGPVTIAVARNMADLLASGQDMLIEFYAPWCGHCKKLSPIWDELGEKMQDEDVIIAKMDATANDVDPRFNVRGFPTIYWVPSKGEPVQYSGGREIGAFVKYIAKEASTELKNFDRDGKTKKEKSEL